MSRPSHVGWLSSNTSRRRVAKRERSFVPFYRPLRFEPLEYRRLLAIVVDTLLDELDGSITDGDISLRDAIAAATPGETIDFSVTGTINLSSLGELVVNKSLTIQGPGANVLTIRAFDPTPAQKNGDGSRVFRTANIVELSGLTLTESIIVRCMRGRLVAAPAWRTAHDAVVLDNCVVFAPIG